MNCQECQDILDNLLVTEPSALQQAALAEHLAACAVCARQHSQARQALAAVSVMDEFPVSSNFKARIMDAISEAQASHPHAVHDNSQSSHPPLEDCRGVSGGGAIDCCRGAVVSWTRARRAIGAWACLPRPVPPRKTCSKEIRSFIWPARSSSCR